MTGGTRKHTSLEYLHARFTFLKIAYELGASRHSSLIANGSPAYEAEE
jgi:hypothetical protein